MLLSFTRKGDIIMEIFKIDNINDFLVEDQSFSAEVYYYKKIANNFLKTVFGGYVDLEIIPEVNAYVEGELLSIGLDKMSLVRPLAKLLGISLNSKVATSEEEEIDFIKGRIQAKLTELRNIQSVAELTYKFPEIHTIYSNKVEGCNKSVIIENTCRIIKPASQAEEVRAKKRKEWNISREQHTQNLAEAAIVTSSGFLGFFINKYYTELSYIADHLDFLINSITFNKIPSTLFQTIDANNILNFIDNSKQKTVGLK